MFLTSLALFPPHLLLMAAAQGQQQPDARSTRQGEEIGCAVQHHTGIHGAALGVGEVRLLDRRIHFALGASLRRHIVRDRRLRHLVLDAVGQVLDVDGIVVFQMESGMALTQQEK